VFTLIWAGRLWPRKTLTLGLDALALVRKKVEIRLLVAGEGESREGWEEHARKLGLADCVKFLGWVPHSQINALYRSSDAFLFTSLRDSFGGVTLEAMGQALPVVALDHQGVAAMIPNDAALKVPVTNPEETVIKLAEAIQRLAENPSLCETMRERAWRFAQRNTWHARAEEMSKLYEQCVQSYHDGGNHHRA
jgi:glycosyltransferase involved in cell wall biosynthesis